MQDGEIALTIPPPVFLAVKAVLAYGLLPALLLPQNAVNALADLLGFLYPVFQCKR